jgi:hypothetical protein
MGTPPKLTYLQMMKSLWPLDECLALVDQSKGKEYQAMTPKEFIANYQLRLLDSLTLEELKPLFNQHLQNFLKCYET